MLQRFKLLERPSYEGCEENDSTQDEEIKAIKVHPLSKREILKIPTKDQEKIMKIPCKDLFEGQLPRTPFCPPRIDAATAKLTGYQYLKQKMQLMGTEGEGFIVVPKQQDYGTLLL